MERKKIKVALVGRPNVGKSALFNRLLNKRLSIVDEAEGITRDRLYGEADFFGRPFTVIDTGGIDRLAKGEFSEEILKQSEHAIEEADILIQVADVRSGVTALDREVSARLLRTKKRLILAVNKVDESSDEPSVGEFYSLGISSVIAISAVQGFQIAELLEEAFEGIDFREEESAERGIRVALVGRPNVGKSTLLNRLVNEERSVVSSSPGTTRDAVEERVIREGQLYSFIDTAGIRKKKAEHEVVDKFAAIRTKEAIKGADICLLLLDAREGMTKQEMRMAQEIEEMGKGCLLLFNKWDEVKGFRMEHCLKSVREEIPFLEHCPSFMISAKTGRNVDLLFPSIKAVCSFLTHRISTGELNRFLEKSLERCHPPMIGGKRLRIYYMAQVASHPPRFVLFVNHPRLMEGSYKKYLTRQFRSFYHFTGVPLHFTLRGKKRTASV
ncbi:MAG TPA: ribosome biogenesis GTPase Der [Parachlamydiales bacterium]|nr:ribosome biogenesis GTPase Der [Parachlamydiales bacterium]